MINYRNVFFFCKTVVSSSLTHWSYHNIALSHRYIHAIFISAYHNDNLNHPTICFIFAHIDISFGRETVTLLLLLLHLATLLSGFLYLN